jgi:4-carboxymuconolactone decarboxylase
VARVRLLETQEADPYIREAFLKMETNKDPIFNLFKTMAHSPRVCRNFLRLGNALLRDSDLSPVLREIAILRVGWLCGSLYEYTKHVDIGSKAGVSQEQINAIPYWTSATCFNEKERAVLAYTDESTRVVQVRDETYKAVRAFLSEQEIVKLTVTIGYYGMVSRYLVAMQVELDPGEKSLMPGVDKY